MKIPSTDGRPGIIKLELLAACVLRAAQRLDADGWDGIWAAEASELKWEDRGGSGDAVYTRPPPDPTYTYLAHPQRGSSAASRRLGFDRAGLYLTRRWEAEVEEVSAKRADDPRRRNADANRDVPSFAFTPRRPRPSFAGSAPRGRERGVWEVEGCVWQLAAMSRRRPSGSGL
ncbi:hypothetical protein B0H16DRAFT_1452751 [Mycena metata]|uniref:Uncharacterized protein n=1 Tax=Mycena metata TaxID=1033252 RepID=A0AAD7JP77_9AGAR|nr:hypothetical protein B0H16DRAFT_1452751 [Mycena metata]